MGGGYTVRERQPLAGRALGGGGRIGEMERDSIVAHGIAGFLKETMMERSDKYYTHICQTSGRLAVVNPNENLFMSPDIDGPMSYDVIETLELDKQENKGREIQETLGPNTFNQHETDFFRAYMPYCAKLMIQECEAMGLSIKLRSSASNPLLEEERIKPSDFNSMTKSSIVNRSPELAEDFKELEELKSFLKERYPKPNQEEDEEEKDNQKGGNVNSDDDDGVEDDADDNNDNAGEKDSLSEFNITQTGGGGGGDGGGEVSEDFVEIKSPSFEDVLNTSTSPTQSPTQSLQYGGGQYGGSHNDDIKNYYLEEQDHSNVKMPIEDAVNNRNFFDGNNQFGGSTSPHPLRTDFHSSNRLEMTNLGNMGNDISGSPGNRAIPNDPISSSLQNMNRPYFPPNQSGGSPSPPQQSPPSSDVKVITLDPNYLMKEDDPFGSNQSGGGSMGMNMNSIHASVPQQSPNNRPAFIQQPPKFENEIFI